jgi:hypothetical protein
MKICNLRGNKSFITLAPGSWNYSRPFYERRLIKACLSQEGSGVAFSTLLFLCNWLMGEITCHIMSPGGSMGPIYLVKIHKIANNSATTEAGEKNKHRFWICRILEIFDVCLSKFENYQISHNKISHRFRGKGNSTWPSVDFRSPPAGSTLNIIGGGKQNITGNGHVDLPGPLISNDNQAIYWMKEPQWTNVLECSSLVSLSSLQSYNYPKHWVPLRQEAST